MYGRLDRLERLQQGGDARRPAGARPGGLVRLPAGAVRAERRGRSTTGRSTARCSTCCRRRRAGCATWTARTTATPRPRCEADLERCASKVELMRADTRSPDCSMSDDMNHINPATTDALIQLMLGGLPTGPRRARAARRSALLRPGAAAGRAAGARGGAGRAHDRGRGDAVGW